MEQLTYALFNNPDIIAFSFENIDAIDNTLDIKITLQVEKFPSARTTKTHKVTKEFLCYATNVDLWLAELVKDTLKSEKP